MPLSSELGRVLRFQRERALRWWHRRPALLERDADIRHRVMATADDACTMSDALVGYFWHAYQHYLDAAGTLAYYPGWPSIYGARNDALEGVSRLAPLWAAYASSPCTEPELSAAMVASLRRTLVHGTDPAHPGYWGDIADRSTLICEAADIALALWLGRDVLWPALGEQQRSCVLRWLRQAVGKRTADNNWHLFVVLVDAVLAVLDPVHRFTSEGRLERVRQFARTEGCFSDGPAGQIDFYNAWGFHYGLYWLGEINRASLDPALARSLGEFCRWYPWLFTQQGLPLFGRSLCYRFAASAPLLACALRDPAIVPPGVALKAYLANWQFFASQGALRAGRPTQGVFGEDMRWLDPYSGPASSLWGTRSLVLFYYAARTLDWRALAPGTLPSEREDRVLRVPALGAQVQTRANRGESCVLFDGPHQASNGVAVRRMNIKDRLREFLYATASRPANNLLKAGQRRFSSDLDLYR